MKHFASAVLFVVGCCLSSGAAAEEIAALQKLLTEAQCAPGPVDGAWGHATEQALTHLLVGSGLSVSRPITQEDIDTLVRAKIVCTPVPDEVSYVDGPFSGHFERIAATDVRKLGCPDCSPTPRILATPDLDGDGTPEIVLSLEAADLDYKPVAVPIKLVIVRADGTPYDKLVGSPARIHAREGVVADFNGDGIDDLFVAAHGKDVPPFNGEHNVLILSQKDGTSRDVSNTNLPQLDVMSHGTAAGDIDGDGDVDIAVVTNAGGGRAHLANYFLINDGAGKFTLSQGRDHLPAGAPRRIDRFLTARLADVDGDGALDLIYTGHGDTNQLSILMLGDGTGHFGRPITLPRPQWNTKLWTTDADVLDIDGDGDKDIVLLHTGEFDGKAFKGLYIQILINDNMNFRDETLFRLWPQNWDSNSKFVIAHNITFADFDGDGDADFLVQSLNPLWQNKPGDLPAQIGLNRGHGVFDPVRADWLTQEAWSARELLPITLNGEIAFVGNSLNGVNMSRGFRTFGHRLYIFRR